MVEIVFESHTTTADNEQKIASGHSDVDLSETGKQQAQELGTRRAGEHFDAIFTSDLQRAYHTAELAFGKRFPIFQDSRLRECDYGDFEHEPSARIEAERPSRIDQPFPGGESYQQRAELMRSFLDELLTNYDGKRVLVVGHRATQYGLETWVNRKPLAELVVAPWHWQPGWTYQLQSL